MVCNFSGHSTTGGLETITVMPLETNLLYSAFISGKTICETCSERASSIKIYLHAVSN